MSCTTPFDAVIGLDQNDSDPILDIDILWHKTHFWLPALSEHDKDKDVASLLRHASAQRWLERSKYLTTTSKRYLIAHMQPVTYAVTGSLSIHRRTNAELTTPN